MLSVVEKLRKKELIWERAIVHYIVFFVLGFFLGLAPTSQPSSIIFSARDLTVVEQSFSVPQSALFTPMINRSSEVAATTDPEEGNEQWKLIPRNLLLIVTITRTTCNGNSDVAALTRLGNTLRLVRPPLLWIVVEGQRQEQEYDDKVYGMLMKIGVMYKNLVVMENFTIESEAEIVDHHRKVALGHIVNHRLNGIVHFASAWDVYDLGFFDQLRDSE